MRAVALGGIAGPVLFTAVVITAAAGSPDYSHIANFISELGATGAPRAALMNYVGFIPAGLLLTAFGVSLRGVLPREPLIAAGAALVMLFGVFAAASGVFSCDAGCPIEGGTIENQIHNVLGPGCFLILIAGTGVLGFRFRSLPGWQHLSLYSLLTSAFAFACFVGLLGSLDARVLTGLWQRVMLGALFLWCGVISAHTYRITTAGAGMARRVATV